MNKVHADAAAALDGLLFDGMTIAAGGFGICGIPENLINAIRDSGVQDTWPWGARQAPVNELPHEVIVFLLGSRYCDTDLLATQAWALFGKIEGGWPRVQAILEYSHKRITFGYQHARVTKTAKEVFNERVGVCRD